MGKMFQKSRSLRLLTATLLFLGVKGAMAPSPAFSQPENQRLNILFVSSFSKDLPAQTDFENGLDKSLGYKKGNHNLFFEFMESPRLKEQNVNSVFAGYLLGKYQGIEFDVIVGWASLAISFLDNNGDLFPSAYRVYVENMGKAAEPDKKLSLKTRIVEVHSDYSGCLKEFFRLEHPSHLYVIGTNQDKAARLIYRQFNDSLASITASVHVEYIFNKTLEQVASKLEAVNPKDAAAFYLLMFSDGEGKQMTPYDVVQQLASRSSIPIYSFWESLMGSGVVGGYLVSVEKTGLLLGKTLLSLQTTGNVSTFLSMRHMYDWRALRRWNISEEDLPEEAIIINRPPNLLTAYRWHILITMVVIVGLMLLSFFLSRALKLRNLAVHELAVERRNLEKTVEERTRKLSQANQELTDSEERFRSLSDAAIEGIAILEKGIVLEANNRLAIMFGYKTHELVGMGAADLVVPEAREDILHKTLSGYMEPYEIMGLKKDGSTIPTLFRARIFEYKGRLARVAVIRDLTEQKRAEAEIKALRDILPICASCKKIKDGKGSWKNLEVYLDQHSEAKISHSLCPECAKRLYPDLTNG
jgi:PAS domain S-box-containing protein